MTGLSRTSIYRAIREGQFPRQHPIGRRAVAWRSDDIERWIAARSAGAC